MRNAQTDVTSSPLPLYWRVFSILREEICDGTFSPSEPLPSEADLSKRFATSRITIRKALEFLKSEGFIVTKQGVGTFIKSKLPSGSRPGSFTMNLSAMWEQMETRILEFGFISAPPNIAELLELPPASRVHKAIRHRSYKRRPTGLLTTYIREQVARNFTRDDFINAPLITLYRREGFPSHTAVQRISARSADPFCAEHLGLEIGSPILCFMRLSRDSDGKPISYLVGQFRPDRYEIELDLKLDGPSQRAVWSVSDKAEEGQMSSHHTPPFQAATENDADDTFQERIHVENDSTPTR